MDLADQSCFEPPGLDSSIYRRVVIRPLARPLVMLLLRAGVSADTVSIAKGIIGIAGAAAFVMPGGWWIAAGVLLLQLSFLLDACDGAVARATGTCATVGGEFLDKLGDATMRSLLYLCWGVGVWRAGGHPLFAFAGGVMAGLWLVVRFCLVESLLENLAFRGEHGAGALEREQESLGKAFIRGESRAGGTEGFLSAFFHPFINLVAVLALPGAFLGGVEQSGIQLREAGFSVYFILWALNWMRKIPWHYRVSNVRR